MKNKQQTEQQIEQLVDQKIRSTLNKKAIDNIHQAVEDIKTEHKKDISFSFVGLSVLLLIIIVIIISIFFTTNIIEIL